MFQFFKSEFFNFEFVRLLGTAPYNGAEISECLDVAVEITDEDPESWYRAWYKQGEKAELHAVEAARNGDVIAARSAYLRASNYFRASQYMFNDRPESPDSRIIPIANRSISNFRHSIKLMDIDVHVLEIPYEGHKLPGYLYLPPLSKRLPGKIPILINCGGADSIQEELYYIYPSGGPVRGYAVITFEGPGQGIVLRRDKLRMRPDWEVVTSSVLDYLQEFSLRNPAIELDLDRIAIAGASMGAYYALRGASDVRVKACVSVDPFYDLFDLATTRMPPAFIKAWLSGWLSDNFFNQTWRFLSRFSYQLKWELTHVMWIFGLPSAALGMREMQQYTLRLKDGGEFLDHVKCPVLVTGAAHTIYTKPEISTDMIFATLNNSKGRNVQKWVAKAPGDGGLQAKVGAYGLSQERTFQFLDEVFLVKRTDLTK
ncbi:alpha/beta-Hydrolase [Glarea lozoyensis ATCC 20868]|uniref:Alpha/beta-Hydrolase n=1 Tax=Glarea lozoyensis (strain ATCC 20868 / MF5171) TaxID=1116229 RepID=S3D5T7_GLAL2|nr:alpha/beta-Hydrolase [Glarea lozoyensis ATCC 20868]EPE33797.1 alpha/beta-Hydrolase [Glarea lozoyensis ATCC 20868]